MLKIMIVEDEPLIAMDLAQVVSEKTDADIHVVSSAAAALRVLDETDFVFLDMNVVDGKTFELARKLSELGIPFAFISASRHCELPKDLQLKRFISKPCTDSDIDLALRCGLQTKRNDRSERP